ncbi:MAG TPA: hypothetical protein VFM93_08910 [Candidatus Limnocylindria bacterium]|nr:hypothetical protein [Candidatus Limnocylindria bacterium]
MLSREAPATELAVASRILARAGVLAPTGRVALRVGTEVVYLCKRGVEAHAMTPYDVVALRLADGLELAGEPPDDAGRYLDALRRASGAGAAALRADGTMLTAASVRECVASLLGRPYEELEAEARLTGALYGAYPAGGDPAA